MLDRSPASTLQSLREMNELPLCAATCESMVQARHDATDLFETGCFLEAANRFLRVLIQSPDCTKSCFNLAVILQTTGKKKIPRRVLCPLQLTADCYGPCHVLPGDTHLAVSLMLRVVAKDDDDAVAHTVLR